MNDKNVEEKAKEYAKSQFRDIYANFSRTDISEAYKVGYIQAVTDQQNTLTQYKNELDTLITHVLEHLEYNSNDENSKQTIVRLCNVIKKQLLNNE